MRKFFYISAIAIATVISSGCDIPGSQNYKIKEKIKEGLFDSDSAKFGEIKLGNKENSFCGTVNAKNRAGGYASEKPFIYKQSTHEDAKLADILSTVTVIQDEPLKDGDFENLKIGISKVSDIRQRCEDAIEYQETCQSSFEVHQLCQILVKDFDKFLEKLYKR